LQWKKPVTLIQLNSTSKQFKKDEGGVKESRWSLCAIRPGSPLGRGGYAKVGG